MRLKCIQNIKVTDDDSASSFFFLLNLSMLHCYNPVIL